MIKVNDMNDNQFKLPENNTGFVAVEICEDSDPTKSCLIFHHKNGYLLYVYNHSVVLMDLSTETEDGGKEIGRIDFSSAA
jgi:hypothetical protein